MKQDTDTDQLISSFNHHYCSSRWIKEPANQQVSSQIERELCLWAKNGLNEDSEMRKRIHLIPKTVLCCSNATDLLPGKAHSSESSTRR